MTSDQQPDPDAVPPDDGRSTGTDVPDPRNPTDPDSPHADNSRRGVDDAPQLTGSEKTSESIDSPDDRDDGERDAASTSDESPPS
jgi:hypothetical protein